MSDPFKTKPLTRRQRRELEALKPKRYEVSVNWIVRRHWLIEADSPSEAKRYLIDSFGTDAEPEELEEDYYGPDDGDFETQAACLEAIEVQPEDLTRLYGQRRNLSAVDESIKALERLLDGDAGELSMELVHHAMETLKLLKVKS